MYTESIEDYLKAIYEIQKESGKVSTNSLSEKLHVAPASVTSMIKKLSEKKLITHKRYQGVKLTKAGLKISLEVIRHHRLIELYLAEALGAPLREGAAGRTEDGPGSKNSGWSPAADRREPVGGSAQRCRTRRGPGGHPGSLWPPGHPAALPGALHCW